MKKEVLTNREQLIYDAMNEQMGDRHIIGVFTPREIGLMYKKALDNKGFDIADSYFKTVAYKAMPNLIKKRVNVKERLNQNGEIKYIFERENVLKTYTDKRTDEKEKLNWWKRFSNWLNLQK